MNTSTSHRSTARNTCPPQKSAARPATPTDLASPATPAGATAPMPGGPTVAVLSENADLVAQLATLHPAARRVTVKPLTGVTRGHLLPRDALLIVQNPVTTTTTTLYVTAEAEATTWTRAAALHCQEVHVLDSEHDTHQLRHDLAHLAPWSTP